MCSYLVHVYDLRPDVVSSHCRLSGLPVSEGKQHLTGRRGSGRTEHKMQLHLLKLYTNNIVNICWHVERKFSPLRSRCGLFKFVFYPLMETLARTSRSVMLDTRGLVLSNWLELKHKQINKSQWNNLFSEIVCDSFKTAWSLPSYTLPSLHCSVWDYSPRQGFLW